MVLCVEAAKTKGARHSGTAVIRRASAETDDDFIALLRRIENHLPNPKRAGKINIVLFALQPPHPRRLAHLHHRKLAIFNKSIARLNLSTEWIMRFAFDPRPVQGVADHFRSPLTAIRDR